MTEKMTRDELSELTGRTVDREFRLKLIAEAEEKNEPLAMVADRYAMPPMFIMIEGQTSFEHNGEMFTPEQFQKRWPYRRFVIVQ